MGDEMSELKQAILFRALNNERTFLQLAAEKTNNDMNILEQIHAINELMRELGLEL
jgi:hypothetical protein